MLPQRAVRIHYNLINRKKDYILKIKMGQSRTQKKGLGNREEGMLFMKKV